MKKLSAIPLYKKLVLLAIVSLTCVIGYTITTPASANETATLSLATSTQDAYSKSQTITYYSTAQKSGTLSHVIMSIPAGATLNSDLRSNTGTVKFYKTGQIIWRPTKPYAITAGARIGVGVSGINLGGAGVSRPWLVAADPSGVRLTVAYGTFTTIAPAGAATCPTITRDTIKLENQKTGTPESTWRIPTSKFNSSIYSGYADRDSYKCGNIANFKIKSTASKYSTAKIYRMGYYGGTGAREIWSTKDYFLNNPQPAAKFTADNPTLKIKNYYDASNWYTNIGIRIDGRFTPGTYLAKFSDRVGHETFVPFTVRDDSGLKHDYLLQQATTTWHAYNSYGNYSFYTAPPANASRLSFNRPYLQEQGSGQYLSLEHGLVYHMERAGYDVAYWTDTDLESRPTELKTRAKTLIIPAHDEYYSLGMRATLADGINKNGVNLVSFGANQMHRPITYTPDKRSFDVKDAYKVVPGGGYAATTFRSYGPSYNEQVVTGAQYGCSSHGDMVANNTWMFKGIAPGTVIGGFVNGEADYQNKKEIAYRFGYTVPIPTGSTVLYNGSVYNCRVSGEPSIVDVVARQTPVGTRVYSGSSFAYGCFVNKSCPANWMEGQKDGPRISISDEDSKNASLIIDNVLRWANAPR